MKLPASATSHRHRESGSALLLVISVIGMMSLLLMMTRQIVQSNSEFVSNQKKANRCIQLAESGIALAMHPSTKPHDATLLSWSGVYGEVEQSYRATIQGEGGKVNPNFVLKGPEPDVEFFERLFEAWIIEDPRSEGKVSLDDAKFVRDLIDRMVDWVDADDDRHNEGMEKRDYEEDMGLSGYPFNRPFYNVDEMLLVPGFETITAIKPNWRDYFTVYSQGPVDLQEAPADLITIIARCDPSDAADLVSYRNGEDGVKDSERQPGDDSEPDDRKLSPDEAIGKLPSLGSRGDWGQDHGQDEEAYFRKRVGTGDTTTRVECVAQVGDFRKRLMIVVRSRTGQPQILTREEPPLF